MTLRDIELITNKYLLGEVFTTNKEVTLTSSITESPNKNVI